MRVLREIATAGMLAAIVWLAGTALPPRVAAQATGAAPSSPSSPRGRAAIPASTPPNADEPGVWHHFGEGQRQASATPSQSGTWHHFGEGNNAPPQPRKSQNWRTYGLSRTQEMEQRMYEMVNRDRADPANTPETNGRALPLQWNDQLAAVARAHSLDMLNQGYFAHQDLQGRNVAGRAEAAGIQWRALGENIAISGSVANAQAAFMNEPRFAKNHRANILSSTYTEVGIGIVQAPDGRLYITQDFCAPPSQR
jgi:uncharacterized protein YkwD